MHIVVQLHQVAAAVPGKARLGHVLADVFVHEVQAGVHSVDVHGGEAGSMSSHSCSPVQISRDPEKMYARVEGSTLESHYRVIENESVVVEKNRKPT